ncbi:MAG: PDZ domain-containing protein, partial [Victivallaceae bacterium]
AATEEEVPAIKQMLGLLPLGKKVELEIARNGKNITIQLTPREKGKVEGEEIDCPRWDITVKSINQFDNQELYFYQKHGVFIYGIKEPGNALRSGLMRNDIILKVDNKSINSLADFKEAYEQAMQNIKNRSRVTLSVMRSGLFRQIILDFSRDFEKE